MSALTIIVLFFTVAMAGCAPPTKPLADAILQWGGAVAPREAAAPQLGEARRDARSSYRGI
ncbi:MAG: hypothetical protein HYR86_15815 [Candidatus Rokubacteria bacterium]|nr:hypothetical protein [Candidatus Rokubacteria bacterium]